MLKKLPTHVTITEVGPRDGFQFESKIIPTSLKAHVIQDLLDAGLPQIQVTSFVSPKKVPQMADAEKLLALLPETAFDRINALVLNAKGLERAIAAHLRFVEVSISASDTHCRKNAGFGFEQAFTQAQSMVAQARAAGLGVRASIQCAFGCAYEGRVPLARIEEVARVFIQRGVSTLALADTTGMAHPRAIINALERLLPVSRSTPLALHLHDTRGLGLTNLLTALELGVSSFDTSLGGMGGCPFVPKAAGNIATEDTLNLLAKLDISTGADMTRIAKCTQRMARFLDKTLPGRMYNLV